MRSTVAKSVESGFSIIELLVVVAVMGLMTVFALPKLVTVRQIMVLDAAAQQLAGDLRRAQVEAIKRNRMITLGRTGAYSYQMQLIGNRTFEGGAAFAAGSLDSVRLAPIGPPAGGGGTFILQNGALVKSVVVNASGLVRVQ